MTVPYEGVGEQVPHGLQVIGRYEGETEGRFPKQKITWQEPGDGGQSVTRWVEAELPQQPSRALFDALDKVAHGQLVSVSLSCWSRNFAYKTDGPNRKAGDRGSMVVYVLRGIRVLSD